MSQPPESCPSSCKSLVLTKWERNLLGGFRRQYKRRFVNYALVSFVLIYCLLAGTAYALVWGRYQTEPLLERLAQELGVDLFICGHQPQEEGFTIVYDRMIILASDHNHGVFLPFDLRRELTLPDLKRLIRPLAAIE